MSEQAKRLFVQGRIGAANAAEFFGVLKEIQAGVDVVKLLDAEPGPETASLLPATLDALYGMIYGLLAACTDERTLARALEIVEQLPDSPGRSSLPIRESQTLSMELLLERALSQGLEGTVLASPAYRRYADQRKRDD